MRRRVRELEDQQAGRNNPPKLSVETNLAYFVKENSCYSFLMRLMLWEISPKCLFLILKAALPRQNGTHSVALTPSLLFLQPLLKPRFHLHPPPPAQNTTNCLRGSSPRCPNSRPPSLSPLSPSKRPSSHFWISFLQIRNVLNQSHYLSSGLKLEAWQKQMCS